MKYMEGTSEKPSEAEIRLDVKLTENVGYKIIFNRQSF